MQRHAHAALRDAKGLEIRLLDVRGLTDIADTMLIATGQSARHVRALTERVLEHMRARGWRPLGVEGFAAGDWVVADFAYVVVHIMRAEARAQYDLESLWDATARAADARAV